MYITVFFFSLQILSWEFCSRPHEELLPRTFVASQVFLCSVFSVAVSYPPRSSNVSYDPLLILLSRNFGSNDCAMN